MKVRGIPSIDILDAQFDCDPVSGNIVRKRSGMSAIQKRADGYRIININGAQFLVHRVIWKMVTRAEPPEIIDHINGDPSDNRIVNLRPASHSQNLMNQKNWGAYPKGVYLHKKSNTFCARINVNRRCVLLGYFKSPNEAAAAYAKAADKYFGKYARHGEAA